MKDYGKVSIIMPTMNCVQYICAAIQSVQSQTYTNWEILVQDDCSTDNTYKILEPFIEKDSRIKYACNPKNSGAAVSRNNAIQRADGRWIAFLDSDDLWGPNKLEKQIAFMVKNDYHFSYTGYQEMFIRLKVHPRQFVISLPPSMKINKDAYQNNKYYADYKYYLNTFLRQKNLQR